MEHKPNVQVEPFFTNEMQFALLAFDQVHGSCATFFHKPVALSAT